MEFLILVAVLCGFIGLYIATMYLNKKVEVPESCRAAYLEAQTCESCTSRGGSGGSCGFSDALEFMKEVKL
ncbi:MAG: hypothetical protein NUK62_03560 [Tenericutes bacterium]|jgi:hypothetical protein|nr:hypothetical protein [Mycoplasmatota bacterium]